MTVVKPTRQQISLYSKFCHYLNSIGGKIDADDARYYKFLDKNLVDHKSLLRTIKLCHKSYSKKVAYAIHLDGRTAGIEGGSFYLTTNGYDKVSGLQKNALPPLLLEFDPNVKLPEAQNKKFKGDDEEWTREEVVRLLTKEAHLVGRMLGTGYDLLEPIHGEWIKQWILNPGRFRVLVHQAHRDSYKSASLRLACAIMAILFPLQTVLIIRKSEDAVKELTNGVSKILDTPLFHKFVSILHPDVKHKGGFKKTTDTALSIDTNLNVSLSGEYQIRALGLGSPLTGKHSSIIVTDDIVVTADRESEAERRNTISKYQEMMNLLSNNKGFSDTRIINIGTPWHEEDAFQLMERGLKDKTEEQQELERISQKDRTEEQSERIRQLNMARGKFVYNCYQTGLMTEKDIEWKKKVLNDDALFMANYMLSLVSDEECPFPRINNVGKYNNSFFADAWEVYAAIDAAYGGVDSCALGIGAYEYDANEVVVYGRRWEKVSIDQNYIEIAEVMLKNNVQTLFMETNTDKGLMGEKFRDFGFNVIGYHESTNKHIKIVSTIRPYWRENGDELLPSVQFTSETEENYLSQIYDYKRGVKKDDAPDNLACLLLKSKFGATSVRIS